ncbi:MAG TPA: glycosyltransferase [Candidatus Saccharimonadales bacterium]|nr:glycosyltransferase [Candidatus Saccharimonadales bacterium]
MPEANRTKVIDLSVIITVHAEGILLHKTLASVHRALLPLYKKSASSEIIIHVDNPTTVTKEYVRVHKQHLSNTTIYTNHFGDLGSSRNFAVQKARGRYVTFIDADDLMSEKWLVRAYTFLESKPTGQYIAHSESTIEFGAEDSVIVKHGETNQATDTLLTVFSNRWNSIIMAPRALLLEEPYVANSPGYGYEDWNLNCRFIARGLHNVLIPKTVIFVRRKAGNSEWLRQKTNQLVLRANPLFSFNRIRNLSLSSANETEASSTAASAAVILPPSTMQRLKRRAVPLLRRVPLAERIGRKAYRMVRPVTAPAFTEPNEPAKRLPDWLVAEWRAMHTIEKQLFPSDELVRTVQIYNSLTPEHYQTGEAFKNLIDHTTHNTYHYILFVPWIKTGGADLLSVHFATNLKAVRPDKNILIIATMPTDSPWASKLPKGIDFMPFGLITQHLSQELQFRLLEQLIENSSAEYLHILNSALGYDFVATHEAYIQATNKKIIATSFSQSVDGTGRVFGYSHTHVPKAYELTTVVTTDNQAVVDMWVREYGFDPAKLIVQHTPIAIPKLKIPERPVTKNRLRVLWAARLCPEKQPELVAKIGRLLKDKPITIDMYGSADEAYGPAFLRTLPPNVRYKRPYDGFFTLPVEQYDVYLYTSLFDGMPIAVLEAAAAKLPLVSSKVGGIPDFAHHKQSGLLLPDLEQAEDYAAALTFLLEHPQLLKIYSEKLYQTLLERHTETAYKAQIQHYAKRIGY